MIKIVTPKNAVIYDERIQKCITTPSAKDLAAISHVSLQVYEKTVPKLMKSLNTVKFKSKICMMIKL